MSTYATDIFEGAGLTEFTLTFSFLSREHIVVTRINADSSTTVLTVVTTGPPTGDEFVWDTDSKIEIGTALAAGQKLEVVRDTPENQQLVQWADGSYIIADDLNESDLQWLYNIQELQDQVDAIDGTVIGEAVKEVIGSAPIVVNSTNPQKPEVAILETVAADDPNTLASDTDVMSELAIDNAFKQHIGAEPAVGNKIGQLKIDTTQTPAQTLYWSGSAWVQISTKGDVGPEGPPGPPPGLMDPSATSVNVPVDGSGNPGNATANVIQDPVSKDIQFQFGLPTGKTGATGDTGPEGPQGPPPPLQGQAAVANNVANEPDGSVGQATAAVAADANGALQFTFGIPVGEQGPIGPPGEGVDYKGLVDATTAPEPSSKSNGDFYVNTASGVSSWTGLTNVTQNDRLIWNAATGVFDRLTPPPVSGVDLGYTPAPNQGTINNSAGVDATLPVVNSTNAGLMTPAEYTKLNGIEAGAEVNPNLSNYMQQGDNVSLLNNDAGYITSADIPPTPTLQQVLDTGNTSTTDLFVGTGGETVKLQNTGTLDASTDVKAGGNVEATGYVKAAAFRIDLLALLP